MFESIEIRRVANGFVVIVLTEDATTEYVFDSPRKALRFVKEFVDAKTQVG